ncbi:MAG TPA: NAD(P)-binding domain-containing protein [Solirubrobacterales bacterium]|nr:NAD(P)-binding domain-containing protein [Solirubrobacterales bacterium]
MQQSAERVAVIGAGVAGLAASKALGDRGIPYVCFETSDDVGGTWYFDNPNGRSAAYRSLHINISRRWAGFRDYPLPDEFPDFAHHSHIHAYLREFADAFDLRRRIRFGMTVERAERLAEGGWELTLSGGEKAGFDALIVCNGHHWAPMLPDPPFPGRFDGISIHSHAYVDPTDPVDFHGMRVLVIGIGNSAADIASELSRRGLAERVVISTRSSAWIVPRYLSGRPFDQIATTKPLLPLAPQRLVGGALVRLLNGHPSRFGLPRPDHRFLEADPTVSGELLNRLGCGDLTAKPNVAELRGGSVAFEDGSEEPFDAIVYATGYRVLFPFFDEELISAPGNVLPLYKRIFKPGIDDLAFIGLAEALPSHFLFDEVQAGLVAMWLDGEWALPPQEEMEAEIAADDRRFTGHFKPSPRHTFHHLLPVYEREISKRVIPAGRRRARAARRPG